MSSNFIQVKNAETDSSFSRAPSYLISRKGKKKARTKNKHSTSNNIRLKLQPFFRKFNEHYRIWGSKLDTLALVAIIGVIATGQWHNALIPITIYYVYVILLVGFRIFMHWDFFYGACRIIALRVEISLTKGKGFHDRLKEKKQ